MSADAERDWWDNLEGDEILDNTAGWPPYNVDSVVDFLEVVLDTGNIGPVLDLGCGAGRLTNRCAERWPRSLLLGVDISPKLLAIASKHRPSNAVYDVIDGRTLDDEGHGPGQIDAAYSVTVFQHLPHDVVASYIRQVGEMLSPSRRFAFTWSYGVEDTFLSHQCDRDDVDGWLEAAGFEKIVHLTNHDHPRGWRWAVATKGSQ